MDRDAGKLAAGRSVRNRSKPRSRDGLAPAPAADARSVVSNVTGEFLGAWPKVDYLNEGARDAVHHITTIQYVMSDINTKSDVMPDIFPGMESLEKIRGLLEAEFGTLTNFANTIHWRPGTVIQQFHRGSLSKDLALVIAKKLRLPAENVLGGQAPTSSRKARDFAGPQDYNDVAQALEDVLQEKGIKLGAAEKATLIAGFLEKLGRKG